MVHKKRSPKGQKIRLSEGRRLMNDLMHFSLKVPLVTVERQMNIKALLEKRNELGSQNVGWYTIFLKAMAIVTTQDATLRRSYISLPKAHIYEAIKSNGVMSVERIINNEPTVLFARFNDPAHQSLVELEKQLNDYKIKPISELESFRQALKYSKLPTIIRRLGWWLCLNTSIWRNKYFGTFAISGVTNQGAALVALQSPLAINLTFGMVNDEGDVNVRLHWDHRAFDGMVTANALRKLEQVLNNTIAEELSILVNSN